MNRFFFGENYRTFRWFRNLFFALVCGPILCCALSAQARTADGIPGYFPETAEIGVSSRSLSSGFEDAAGLSKVKDGRLVYDVGFIRYERVDYSDASSLSIEIFTLLDSRAAYSLLTLLRDDPIQTGPPGDAFASGNDVVLFSRGRFFVRIQGKDAPKELLEKSASTVGGKLAHSGGEQPRLPSYLPADGLDAYSLRYFPSRDTYETWTSGQAPWYIDTTYDVEIVTADYSSGKDFGTVALLRFPTDELAEEYFDALAVSAPVATGDRSVYAKLTGPLVACLEGNHDSVSAGKLLSTVKFSYSLRWVYGDEQYTSTKTVWGVPVSILNAVVNSLIFTAVASTVVALLGLAIGVGRFTLREYRDRRSPRSMEENSGLTWLNLR